MNKLPPEIIVHISSYLSFRDNIKLRLINKEFKSIVDNLLKMDLALIVDTINNSNKNFCRNWFYTNKSNCKYGAIEYNYEIKITNLDSVFNIMFLSIKKLFFVFSYGEINLDKTINKLRNLEELNILSKMKSHSTISLPLLKILYIKGTEYTNLKFDTPSLSIFKCNDLENFKFIYPEKLTYLYLDLFATEINLTKKIKSFINLQYFFSNNYNNFEPILLKKLDQLKELHFYKTISNYRGLIKFRNAYNCKLEFQLFNLKMFVSGIDYEYLKKVDYDKLNSLCQSSLIKNYYSRTTDILPFIKEIEFYELPNHSLNRQFKSAINLSSKLPNIKHIKASISEKQNIDFILKFLSNYPNLITLKLLINDDNYYPKLAKSCKRLENLYITIRKSTNLDFILKFKYLIFLFLVDEIVDENMLKKLFKELKFLSEIRFYHENDCIIYNGEYYLFRRTKFESLDEVIQYLKENVNTRS